MALSPLGSYLRTHRKRSGLSQRELADILGLLTEWQVSQHEKSLTVPILLTAMSYEILFRVPISRLFPGIYETVRDNVESRLAELEKRLQQSSTKGREAIRIARKLEWLFERNSLVAVDPTE